MTRRRSVARYMVVEVKRRQVQQDREEEVGVLNAVGA
jgi:hypothetical protein